MDIIEKNPKTLGGNLAICVLYSRKFFQEFSPVASAITESPSTVLKVVSNKAW